MKTVKKKGNAVIVYEFMTEELGLIRKRSRDHTTSLYTAEAVYFEEEGGCEGCKNDTPIPDKVSRFEEGCRAFCGEERLILMPKEKEKRNNITTTTTTTNIREGEADKTLKNPIRFRRFGPSGLVIMTGEQHAKLCDLLGDDIAENYLFQLEAYLAANPAGYVKNHYKTILKWAADDARA